MPVPVGTTPFQIGTLVPDVDTARARHEGGLGVGPWVDSGWKTGRYWDGPSNTVLDVRQRAAFGRLTPDLALEFIQVDSPAPRVWDLGTADATAHLGYWAHDTRAAAAALLELGATLVMARASDPEVAAALVTWTAGDPLPAGLDMCYLATGDGLLVELVPTAIWAGRLRIAFGDGIDDVLAPPPATSS